MARTASGRAWEACGLLPEPACWAWCVSHSPRTQQNTLQMLTNCVKTRFKHRRSTHQLRQGPHTRPPHATLQEEVQVEGRGLGRHTSTTLGHSLTQAEADQDTWEKQ